VALLTALFATTLLTALGMTVLLLGSAESTLAANDREADAAFQAARGGAALAVAELRAMPSWSGVTGTFVDSTLTPSPPWAGPAIDLSSVTSGLQADTVSNARGGVPVPVWRLFEYGPINRLIPAELRRHPYYLVVWVADSRGVLLVHSTALGAGGTTASVDVALNRSSEGVPRLLSFRPNPPGG
jgi:hypothetical protein